MARSLPFFLVDVFADAPLTGNPLAVVADADEVDEQVMRSIAREFNQSETTFVLPSPREDVAWRLRSFTPGGVEVGGAGHNALGAWWWLAGAGHLSLSDGGNRFSQEIGGRVLPVEVIARGGHPPPTAVQRPHSAWPAAPGRGGE
jgi:trans-2,3-dihydro-3-hydroxyanthranilate isomerase